MFNCPKCWENPCICGNEYNSWSDEKIRKQIKMFQNILKQRTEKNIRFLNVEEHENFHKEKLH